MHSYRHATYQRGGSQSIFIEQLYISPYTLTLLSKLLLVKRVNDATRYGEATYLVQAHRISDACWSRIQDM